MPNLTQKNADGSLVKQWTLQSKPLTVGRGDDATAKVDDGELSRRHFLIEPEEGLSTVIGKLQKEPKGYSTYIREISQPPKGKK